MIVRLDPPDRGDAWNLAVFASGDKGDLVPIEHAIVNAGTNRRDARRRDDAPRTDGACPASPRRYAPRPGDPEPGRGVGAHGVDGPEARGRRIRRANSGAVTASTDADAASVRRGLPDLGGRREPARRCPLVGGLRRRGAHGGRYRAAGQRSAAADPIRWALGRDRSSRPECGGGRARRTRRDEATVGRRDAATRAWSRGLAARRRYLGRRRGLGRGSPGVGRHPLRRAGRRTERLRR